MKVAHKYLFYSGFEKDPRNSKIQLSIVAPIGAIAGKYIISGKALLFPLNGRGFGNLTLGKWCFHFLSIQKKN